MTIFNNLIENTTGLPQGVLLSDECLASIAISLKRIADTMGDGVRPAAEVPPTIPWNVTAHILDSAHAALRTVDAEVVDLDLDKAVVNRPALDRVGDAIVAIEEFAREHGITLREFNS